MNTKFNLKNGAEFSIDVPKGIINSIVYGGKQFVDGAVSLFAVKLRRRDGSGFVVGAKDCVFADFNGKTALYTNDAVDVAVHFELLPDESAIVLRADVKNKTEWLIEWVELMSVDVCGKLRDEGGRGAIVYPFNEGGLVTNMAYRERLPYRYDEPKYPSKSGYSIFPNMICSQFLAYVDDGAGLYLGMHDVERTTKHIDFRYDGDAIKLQMRVFANADYGQSYVMPFDCVMTVFDGDWQDACEIYRTWFERHLPSGLKKIAQNKLLPQWYHNSPITLIYPVRGKKDTGDMTPNALYPYTNVLPIVGQLAEQTHSQVLALLMHWEGTAPWAPPYVWPPLGGEKLFADFLKAMHEQNHLVGLYMSGMGYTIQSNILPSYNRLQEFEADNIAEIVCSDSDGTRRGIICPDQRSGYDLCPACEKTKQIMSDEISRVCKSGIDYLQALDQNHGGCSYFCYSDKHGHVPAPGKWQAEETCKMLDLVDKNGVVLGCESAAAEPVISRLAYNDNRFQLNLYLGMPIPIYAYLYHEYVNNFMGNQVCAMLDKSDNNYPYRLAYSFVAGDMLSLVISDDGQVQYSWGDWIAPKDKCVDKQIAFSFLGTLNSWRKGKSAKYLHIGKMVKGIKVLCDKQHFVLDDGSPYTPDSVLTAAYELDRKTVQFIVNYNTCKVDVNFNHAVCGYSDCELLQRFDNVKQVTLEPLSVAMLELN